MSIHDANGNLHSDSDGRFTEKTGTRPGGALAGPKTVLPENVQVEPFQVPTWGLAQWDLPAWPKSLPQPNLDCDYDSGTGWSLMSASVGDEEMYTIQENDGQSVIYVEGAQPDGWTPAESEAVSAWMIAAHRRANFLVNEVHCAATTDPAIRQTILDLTQGTVVAAEPGVPTRQELLGQASKALADLDLCVSAYKQDTNDGDQESPEDYELLEDARLAFASRAEAILRQLAAAG